MSTDKAITTLTDTDKICFGCPLDECNEDDARCPYWQAMGRNESHGSYNRWKDLQEQVRNARPGHVITLQVTCADLECVEKAARRVRKVHVRNVRDGEGWLMIIEPAEASC